MRTVAMCLSFLQAPRCRINNLTGSWWKSFHSISRKGGNPSSFKLHGSNTHHELKGGHSRRWVRQTSTTKAEKGTLRSNTINIRHEISDTTVSSSTKVDIIHKPDTSKYERIQHCDVQEKIAESRDPLKLITVIVFDIETTGFSRENERIIEIALQDLLGGEMSTFQTLINPERYIPNPHIHGISTPMVNRPGVPRMKELIPILLQYVKSRQKPGGQVLWIAHNARSFDVPFLVKEFSRCSFEIPSDWLFVDSLALAREWLKSGGPNLPSKVSLQALREYYGIPLAGSAHRAMSDVHSLSLILQRLTFDLKLPISGLVERSFRASDLNTLKKKKNSS
ncbi:hypothetical protein LguiA_026633 [Lonicera macranthoides]